MSREFILFGKFVDLAKMTTKNSILTKSGNRILTGVSAVVLAVALSSPALAQGVTAADVAGADQTADQAGPSADDQPPQTVQTAPAAGDRVVVTARRVEEDAQDVPIPVAVLGEAFLADILRTRSR